MRRRLRALLRRPMTQTQRIAELDRRAAAYHAQMCGKRRPR